jgi:hypothetical protein
VLGLNIVGSFASSFVLILDFLNYLLKQKTLPIFGPTKGRDGTWRIKTNDELDKLIRR